MNRIKNCVKTILLLTKGLFIFLEKVTSILESFFNKINKILKWFNNWFKPICDNWIKDLNIESESEKLEKDEDEDEDDYLKDFLMTEYYMPTATEQLSIDWLKETPLENNLKGNQAIFGLCQDFLDFIAYCYPKADFSIPYTYDVHRHLFKMCKAKWRNPDGSINNERNNDAILFLETTVFMNYCYYRFSQNITDLNKQYDVDEMFEYIVNKEYLKNEK